MSDFLDEDVIRGLCHFLDPYGDPSAIVELEEGALGMLFLAPTLPNVVNDDHVLNESDILIATYEPLDARLRGYYIVVAARSRELIDKVVARMTKGLGGVGFAIRRSS
jgi:hypothetical protein